MWNNKNYALLSFVCTVSLWLAPAQAQTNCHPTTIYFANGMMTDYTDAVNRLDILSAKVTQALISEGRENELSSLEFGLQYDSYPTLLQQLLTAALQSEQTQYSASLQQYIAFWQLWANSDTAPSWFQQLVIGIQTIPDPAAIVFQPDLQEQVLKYQYALGSKRNVVVVAHSQGNFYTDQAYSALSGTEDLSEFHMVSVATPAPYVAGDGPHTTVVGDFIWHVPGALAPNPELTNTPGSTICGIYTGLSATFKNWGACHDFISSYLAGDKTGPKIMDDVLSAVPSCAVEPTAFSLSVKWTTVPYPQPNANTWEGTETLTIADGNWTFTGSAKNQGSSSPCVTTRSEFGSGSTSIPVIPTSPTPFTFPLKFDIKWTNTDGSGCSTPGYSYSGPETVSIIIQATPAQGGGYTLSTNTVYPPNGWFAGAQTTVTANGFLQ